MNIFKIILITTAVNLPLSVYVSTLISKPAAVQTPIQIHSSTVENIPLISKNSEDHQQNDEMVLLKTDVQALKLQLASLKNQIQSSPKTKASNAIKHDNTIARNDEAMLAEEQKHFAVEGAALESAFRQQTVNAKWSAETIDLIGKGLASDKIGASSMISLECRSDTCRLELANNGKNQPPDFVEFPQQIAGELSNLMVSQTESSDSSTVFYLSKEEFVLPNGDHL
ncbi:hypothetical protein [Crenothrix sp.]|uniref:hypothetical protein n=1 Tax=Crenothrix sp. TaxID=3100433 RepID=UPI00374DB1CB